MKDDIELRSEKIRNIIGEIPPRLVRTGTTVIIVVIAIMILCAYIIKFNGKNLIDIIIPF